MSLEWVSVVLVGVCLAVSVAILVVVWRVWGTTERVEQDGKERLEILREHQERLEYLREERRILLEELEKLREQQERLQWLREGRAALLGELKRLRSLVEQEKRRVHELPSASTEQPQFATVGDQSDGQYKTGTASNGHSTTFAREAQTLGRSARPEKGDESLKVSGSPVVARRHRLQHFLVKFVARLAG